MEEGVAGAREEGEAPHVEEDGGVLGGDLFADRGGGGGEEVWGGYGGEGRVGGVVGGLEELDHGRCAEGVTGEDDAAGLFDVEEAGKLCKSSGRCAFVEVGLNDAGVVVVDRGDGIEDQTKLPKTDADLFISSFPSFVVGCVRKGLVVHLAAGSPNGGAVLVVRVSHKRHWRATITMFRADDHYAMGCEGAGEMAVRVPVPSKTVRENHGRPSGRSFTRAKSGCVLVHWDRRIVKMAWDEGESRG